MLSATFQCQVNRLTQLYISSHMSIPILRVKNDLAMYLYVPIRSGTGKARKDHVYLSWHSVYRYKVVKIYWHWSQRYFWTINKTSWQVDEYRKQEFKTIYTEYIRLSFLHLHRYCCQGFNCQSKVLRLAQKVIKPLHTLCGILRYLLPHHVSTTLCVLCPTSEVVLLLSGICPADAFCWHSTLRHQTAAYYFPLLKLLINTVSKTWTVWFIWCSDEWLPIPHNNWHMAK